MAVEEQLGKSLYCLDSGGGGRGDRWGGGEEEDNGGGELAFNYWQCLAFWASHCCGIIIQTAQSFSRLSTNMAIFLWEANIKIVQVKRVGEDGLHFSGSVQGPSTGSYKQHQPTDTIKRHWFLHQLSKYQALKQDSTPCG